MYKTTMSALLFIMTFTTFADEVNSEQVAKERQEWEKRYFSAQGTAVPDGGVTVLPESRMSAFSIEERAKNKASIQRYGYIKEPSSEAQSLMNFSTEHPLAPTGSVSSNDEGLHRTISEIHMAYDFHGVPNQEISKDLGVVPSVTYVKDKGWAGAIQFFEKNEVGTCSYRENNLIFSHGAAAISEETATRDVNGKVTVANVKGQKDTGFLYSISWYDNHYFRELNCANAQLSIDKMKSVLKLAQSIDY